MLYNDEMRMRMLMAARARRYQQRARLRGMTVGIDFLQALALFSHFDFQWPPVIRSMFDVASVFSFAIQQAAPECSIPMTFWQKWEMVQVSPLALCAVLCVYYGVVAAVVAARRGTAAHAAVGRLADLAVGSCFTVLYYTFFVVVRGGLEILDCRLDKSGRYHLDSEPTITCYSAAHSAMVPFAALSLLFYGLGIPALFASALFRHRDAMRRDVAMMVTGRGDSALENPDYWVRRRYSRLYSDYDPKCGRARVSA